MGKSSIINNKLENPKPHLGISIWKIATNTSIVWILLILIFIIINLLTYIVSDKTINGDGLILCLSNFATLLSIFLSISSICFALYTSMQTSRQYDNMSQTATEIRVTNEYIAKNHTALLRYVRDISKEIAHLDGKFDINGNNKQPDERMLTKYEGIIPSNIIT